MKYRLFYLLFSVIVIVSLFARMYNFNSPIADWHSWRQVDTAAVARNFIDTGFDPLRPRYDDVSNIQSGKDNPEGYRMVEFPIYQILGYWVYKVFPGLSIEQALRIVSITASLVTLIMVMLIGKRLGGIVTGLAAGLLYGLLPYSIFYGRSILPEPLMVCFSVLAVYLALRMNDDSLLFKKILFCALCVVSSALALLVKPFAVFLLLPVGLIFVKSMVTERWSLRWYVVAVIGVVAAILAVLPLMLWRQWILQFPEGIPASSWLFNEGNIRLKGAWFHWLFAERIGKLMLGYWGIAFLVYGLTTKVLKRDGVLFGWGIGLIAYMVIIARGNVQHDYYQQPLLPFISLLAGLGIMAMLKQHGLLTKIKNSMVVIVLLAFTFAFTWFEIRGFYWINRPEIVEAGRLADQLIPKNAKVIAPYNGDTTFLYQTRRQGWPLGFEIDKKIAQGATHYVTVSPSDSDGETKDLASRYRVLVRNERFAIIDLTQEQ